MHCRVERETNDEGKLPQVTSVNHFFGSVEGKNSLPVFLFFVRAERNEKNSTIFHQIHFNIAAFCAYVEFRVLPSNELLVKLQH